MQLFHRISEHFQKKLPFVIYRKPNENKVIGVLQSKDDLVFTEDFSKKGFVFAPFQLEEKALIFPFDSAEFLEENYVPESFENTSDNFLIENQEEVSQQHIKLVSQAVSAIKRGDYQKIVLSRRENITLSIAFIKIYKRLLDLFPSAMVYCWYHPKVGMWAGATPEKLVSIKDNQLMTMSLAGTQAFQEGTTPEWGIKEREEQQLVTDFITETLRPFVENLEISEPKSVRAGNVVHLRTDICGKLSDKAEFNQIIRALHPTPAVCGLPKEAALQYILKNETYPRKFYTGFFGILDANNATELFVNLRCMEIFSDSVFLYIGGGITTDSIPESEWNETVIKSHAMKRVLF